VPDALHRIELWRIGWKVEDFHMFAMI
jgi:hypothetical protein